MLSRVIMPNESVHAKKVEKKDESKKRSVKTEEVAPAVVTPQVAPLTSKRSGLMGAVDRWLKAPNDGTTLQAIMADKVTPQKMKMETEAPELAVPLVATTPQVVTVAQPPKQDPAQP